jgi:acetyl esterase/lipase
MMEKRFLDIELQGDYFNGQLINTLLSRVWGIRLMNAFTGLTEKRKRKGVVIKRVDVERGCNGPNLPAFVFKPDDVDGPLPIMLYTHGGGYVVGSPLVNTFLDDLIRKRPCIIVAPKYRKALEEPYPAALNDCYDTLLWIKKNWRELGGCSDKIMIYGESAGGGLASAVVLKNRDQKDVEITFQMPVYPMLDYRNNTPSARISRKAPFWNQRTNSLAWRLYLKKIRKEKQKIPSYASPALNNDFTDLPPAISFVGDCEPFRDEVIQYFEKMGKSGIEVTFNLFPGTFHAFELIRPEANISQLARNFILDAYAKHFDRHYL